MVIMGRTDRASARTPRRGIALLTAFVCAVALATASAQAVPTGSDPGKEKRKVDAQVDKLKDQLDETGADLSAAYTALQSTQNQLPGARAALDRAQNAAAAADRANTVAAQELEAAKASEKKAEDKLASTTKEVASSRTRVAQFAAQIYQEQGFGQLDMALSSTDPQQFADRIALVDTVMDVQSQTMDRLATEQASLTALEDHLSALRKDSAEKKKQAAAALQRAQSARDAAAAAKAQLDSLAAQQAAEAKSVAGKLAAEKARLASMQAEQSRLKKILVQRAAEAKRRAQAAARAAAARRAAGKPSRGSGGSTSGGGSSNGSGYLSRPVSIGLGQLRVRHALPPDPALLAPALRARLRRALWHTGARGRQRHRDQRRLGRRLRQPGRRRPRLRARRRPGQHLQPPEPHRGARRLGQARPADRLQRHHRVVHRLPPALRDAGERQLRRPAPLALTARSAHASRWGEHPMPGTLAS